jgi:hypothetical protein
VQIYRKLRSDNMPFHGLRRKSVCETLRMTNVVTVVSKRFCFIRLKRTNDSQLMISLVILDLSTEMFSVVLKFFVASWSGA